jgi:hypothetical protein
MLSSSPEWTPNKIFSFMPTSIWQHNQYIISGLKSCHSCGSIHRKMVTAYRYDKYKNLQLIHDIHKNLQNFDSLCFQKAQGNVEHLTNHHYKDIINQNKEPITI